MSGWSVDQRAELTEALAEADLAHVWEDTEVVVPEELEAEVDALFERLEAALGPFAVGLDADDPGRRVRARRVAARPTARLLARALVESEVPHRWDGATVVVATDAETTVDELLDGIEQGTLVLGLGDRGRRHRRARSTRSSRPPTAWPATPTTAAAATTCSASSPSSSPAVAALRRRRGGVGPSRRGGAPARRPRRRRRLRRRATSSAPPRRYALSCGRSWRRPAGVRNRPGGREVGEQCAPSAAGADRRPARDGAVRADAVRAGAAAGGDHIVRR